MSSLKKRGKSVLWISIGAVLGTALTVFIGLILIGIRPEVALILAGIALATDPAATIDVIHQTRSEGEFSKILESVVAIDDAWGLIIFSLFLAIAQTLYGNGDGLNSLWLGGYEIGGAILLGLFLGNSHGLGHGTTQARGTDSSRSVRHRAFFAEVLPCGCRCHSFWPGWP